MFCQHGITLVIYVYWGITVQLIELLQASLKQNWSSQVHLGSECVQLLGSLCTAFPVCCFPGRCLTL